MDLYWGYRNHGYQIKNRMTNKYRGVIGGQKRKMYELDDDSLIYSIGTQVHFTAEINNDTIEALIKEITKVVNENLPKFGATDEKVTITYIVDSPGGSVTSVLKFVDFISMVKNKHKHIEFASIITGLAASAGTIMCVIADRKYMTKHAFAMIHELSSGNAGGYTKLLSYSKFIESMHNKLTSIYLNNCKLDKEKLEDLLMRETWFDANQYMELGFIEDIKG
jgi:ATP-dependent protease ClpP protease subunit